MFLNFEQNISLEASYIHMFLSPSNLYGGEDVIMKDHPELEKVSSDIDQIEEYLRSYYNKEEEAYKEGLERTKRAWQEKEKDMLPVLCKIMDYDLSSAPEATCVVGSIGIYPRDIKERVFLTGFFQESFEALTTIIHEYTHFLYFDKWEDLFPEDIPEAYKVPNIFWQLSEILAIIITTDERILGIVPDAINQEFWFNNRSYNHLRMPGSDCSVVGYFRKLYLEHKNGSFDDFLKKSREEVLKIKGELVN